MLLVDEFFFRPLEMLQAVALYVNESFELIACLYQPWGVAQSSSSGGNGRGRMSGDWSSRLTREDHDAVGSHASPLARQLEDRTMGSKHRSGGLTSHSAARRKL